MQIYMTRGLISMSWYLKFWPSAKKILTHPPNPGGDVADAFRYELVGRALLLRLTEVSPALKDRADARE